MYFSKNIIVYFMCFALMAFLSLTGCSALQPAQPIQPGELVEVDYTCRLQDGIVATTSEKIATDESLDKSYLFKAGSQGYQPVLMRATEIPEGVDSDDRNKSFYDHIAVSLTGKLAGMQTGKKTTLELNDELIPDLSRDNRYLQLTRVWRYAKEEIIARQEVENKLGRTLEVGEKIDWRGPFTAQVEEVTDNFVKFKILAAPDAVMESPFGNGKIRDGGERWWEVVVDVEEGRLVMSGGLMGRISEVGDKMFTVDFGYPFANETLNCDVVTTFAPDSRKQAVKSGSVENTQKYTGAATAAGTTAAALAGSNSTRNLPGDSDFHAGIDTQKYSEAEHASGDPNTVDQGDLAAVRYKAFLENGTLVQTNIREIAVDPTIKKESWYRAPETYGPVEIMAGEQAIFPGLGNAILGMETGEKKEVPLIPDMAFGPKDGKKIQTYDAVRRIPILGRVVAKDYLQRFGTFPVKGKEVQFTPYFKSRVIDVTEQHVTLKALAQDGKRVKNHFGGYTEIQIVDDEVVLQLVPVVGTPYSEQNKNGIISKYDGKTFTVDYNHPLAGKPVVLEVEVVSVTKTQDLRDVHIEWIEDHQKGVSVAEETNKPMVLVLYAGWCGWSKKLLNEAVEDVRIKALRNEFVWAKVDADQKKEYKDLYGVSGFPMIVLLSSDWQVIKKIDGYRDAAKLREELLEVLNGTSGATVEVQQQENKS